MRFLRMSPLQWVVHLAAWVLATRLAVQAYTGDLGVNPIQTATVRTGFYALSFLVLALAVSPLNTIFNWRQAVKARRPLGVYAFLFALVHLLIFVWIDFGWQWEFLRQELLEKRFIWAGLATFLLLLPLALTSYRGAMKALGKNWKRLHRLIYLAAPLAVLHFAWVRKGDLLRLQGDILLPLLFGLLVALLLLARVPAVKRWLVSNRVRQGARIQPPRGENTQPGVE